MPADRIELAAATVTDAAGRSTLYAIGGRTTAGGVLAKVTAYNVATNTWTFRRLLPEARYRTNGAGVIDGRIYVSGGYGAWGPERSLYMYDPAANTWTRKRDMPVSGASGVSGVINGRLYVVTVCFDYCPATLRALFRYNPGTDRWTTLTPPPEGLFTSFNGGGVIGGKLYLLGNYGPDGRHVVYDPTTDQWTPRTPLARARGGSATTVLDGKLYVMGGNRIPALAPRDTLDVTIVYDPATDSWTRRAPLPTGRTRSAGGTVLLNGKPRIEVVGGSAPGDNVQYIP
jgi:N-acetylneuraminic acid mutarotase